MIEFTQKVIGSKYELGLHDCFTVVIDYLKFCGANIPNKIEYKHLSSDNYKREYLKNPEKTIQCAFEYISKFCHEVKISKAMAGDILYLEDDDGSKFLGVDGGNGNIITAVIDKNVSVEKNCKRLRALRFG